VAGFRFEAGRTVHQRAPGSLIQGQLICVGATGDRWQRAASSSRSRLLRRLWAGSCLGSGRGLLRQAVSRGLRWQPPRRRIRQVRTPRLGRPGYAGHGVLLRRAWLRVRPYRTSASRCHSRQHGCGSRRTQTARLRRALGTGLSRPPESGRSAIRVMHERLVSARDHRHEAVLHQSGCRGADMASGILRVAQNRSGTGKPMGGLSLTRSEAMTDRRSTRTGT